VTECVRISYKGVVEIATTERRIKCTTDDIMDVLEQLEPNESIIRILIFDSEAQYGRYA
jgi:hypothetical protein